MENHKLHGNINLGHTQDWGKAAENPKKETWEMPGKPLSMIEIWKRRLEATPINKEREKGRCGGRKIGDPNQKRKERE